MLTVCLGVSYIQSILFLYVIKQCYKNMKQPQVLNGVTHEGEEPYIVSLAIGEPLICCGFRGWREWQW